MEEIIIKGFSPIKRVCGEYLISKDGVVISVKHKTPRVMTPQHDGRVLMRHNGRVHLVNIGRLMAETFIPNPDNKPLVGHIDGNVFNNKLSNLEWVTRSENIKHSIDNGLRKLSKKVKVQCLRTGKVYGSKAECAKAIGVNYSTLNYWIEQGCKFKRLTN